MANVLIATLWEKNPILRTITNVGIQRLFVLIDKDPEKTQLENLKAIEDAFGEVVEIKSIEVPKLDVYEIAKKVTELIEMQPNEEKIYINLTAGMKTVALGLLYGSYARADYISQIIYNPDPVHGESSINLPILTFRLSETQKKVLKYIEQGKFKNKSYVEAADEIDISRAMLYNNLNDLRAQGLIEGDKEINLTDAGKIARL